MGVPGTEGEAQRLWRLAGSGATMASEILAGTLLGWLADKAFGTGRTFLIIGTIAGVAIGLGTFIRSALKATEQAGRNATRIAHEHELEPLPDPPDPRPENHSDVDRTDASTAPNDPNDP